MKSWQTDGDGAACSMLAEEADMLATLGRQVLGLHRAVIDRTAVESDPVMARLYPDAYEDAADAAEFRRFASGDIAYARMQSMTRMVVDLESALPTEEGGDVVRIEVDAAGADAWLRALGEVRLVLHVRTGQDRAELPDDVTDDDIAQLRDVIDWVGFVQGTLLEALDGRMQG
ncbi:DUF2017 family protein [Agrococcus jenensis]|uniref:Uncharacterized protein DUF2017 n=1 Tax=Agrococcus jenensis TaxID=46353 RepID=A0A3N2AV22_9MICO|nr:DUF2017 family protein [Agrococcus jenensis]ROR66602.1 uncharacterized protein DUF2017 [Agrococcus jenensis]